MSQISAYCVADNSRFRLKVGDIASQTLSFQTNEGANSQPNVIALGDFQTKLSTLNARKLLQTAMVNFNLSGIQCVGGSLFKPHSQLTRRPVFRVAVWVNRPKHFNPAIAFEMDMQARVRYQQVADGTITPVVNT